LHSLIDVSFSDRWNARPHQGRRAQTQVVLEHIALTLISLDPVKQRGSLKTRRIILAPSDRRHSELLGDLNCEHAIALPFNPSKPFDHFDHLFSR
jgi:hypothetical protein